MYDEYEDLYLLSFEDFRITLFTTESLANKYLELLTEYNCQVELTRLCISTSDDSRAINEFYVKPEATEEEIKNLYINFGLVLYNKEDNLNLEFPIEYRHCLVYREDLEKCIVTEHTPSVDVLLENFDLFKYVKGYNLCKENLKKLKEFLRDQRFIDFDELSRKLNSLEILLDLQEEKIEDKVYRIVNENYVFCKGNKTKVTQISSMLSLRLSESISTRSIQKILAVFLEKHGCYKKRFSDGIYYMGISHKEAPIVSTLI